MIKVEILEGATEHNLKDINFLIPQLTLSQKSPPLLDRNTLRKFLDQKDHCYCVVVRARVDSRSGIVALGTIHFSFLPSGLVAETGDLVVDKKYRSLGLGRMILEKLIELAEKKGARHVSLRVNPKRGEAIKMYLALGFEKYPAAFYRINFPRK